MAKLYPLPATIDNFMTNKNNLKSKATFLFLPFILSSFFSCSDYSPNKQSNETQGNISELPNSRKNDPSYMHTGFYFLTDKQDGVQMKKENSNDVYSLKKIPFASVINIKQTELKTTKLEQGDYTELCVTFDTKGTRDLKEGTGNISHQKIAVVIAGKLLYVVDNTSKIKTGVMCVGLVGYSKEEMNALKQAVDQKN